MVCEKKVSALTGNLFCSYATHFKKMRLFRRLLLLLTLIVPFACNEDDDDPVPVTLVTASAGGVQLDLSGVVTEGIRPDRNITLIFSRPLDQAMIGSAIQLKEGEQVIYTTATLAADGRTVSVDPDIGLKENTIYTLVISNDLQGAKGEPFAPLQIRFKTSVLPLSIVSVETAGRDVTHSNRIIDVPLDLSITIHFSAPLDAQSITEAVTLQGTSASPLQFSFSNENATLTVTSTTPLRHLTRYQFRILQSLQGAKGQTFAGYATTLYTRKDETPKMPVVSDDELLTIVQQQTFNYFWDFAHPASGMARERNTSGDVVTSGGSGFGIMALIVGIERGFITRAQGLERMELILTFLENADRFHGAWPHWMNGNTGDLVPFSANDNGGDLVETSFLIQGLLTFRQYLDASVAIESNLIDRINALWEAVEWDWYTQGGQDVLYWHWSPDKQWIMNHPIRGYNEALITYFLAAASPTHPVGSSVYHQGWAGNGSIINDKTFYGIQLPLGFDYGGPLFFAHYSFLGLDPRNLQDTYANYWTQNVNHSLINHAYVVDNPKDYVGYSDENWGLTASDNPQGYSAHSPTNDLGVIAPSAALSSFPYTPVESMKALKFFYYSLGDRLWGPYGFYDAFDLTAGWTADSYLAIDQGPIIVMIENHRSGLLWDLFMSAPEVGVAMDKLGFTR